MDDGAGPTLLLYPTDPVTRHAIETTLARTYALAFAGAGGDPATLAPDAVLCDLSEDALAVLDAFSDAVDAPAVVCTYPPTAACLVPRALRAGAAYCLPKPLDAEVLRVLLHRCLDERAARRAARRALRRIEQELAEARQLQRGMMPAADRRLAGASVAARWQPCAELGGDLLDFAEAGPSSAALLIADVSGHGVPAALLTTLIKSAFRSTAHAGFPPGAIAAAVADGIAPFGADRFVTLVAARLDSARHTVEYVNAGHPPPLVVHHGRVVDRLRPTGPLIGPGLPDAAWEVATVPCPPNGGVLMFTDGVLDARGDAGRFGPDRLLEAVARHRGGGGTLLDGILASVAAFTTGYPLEDDVTLLTAAAGLPGLA